MTYETPSIDARPYGFVAIVGCFDAGNLSKGMQNGDTSAAGTPRRITFLYYLALSLKFVWQFWRATRTINLYFNGNLIRALLHRCHTFGSQGCVYTLWRGGWLFDYACIFADSAFDVFQFIDCLKSTIVYHFRILQLLARRGCEFFNHHTIGLMTYMQRCQNQGVNGCGGGGRFLLLQCHLQFLFTF